MFAGVPALCTRLFRDRNIGDVTVLACIVAAGVGVHLPHKYFPHYFIQMYPPLCIAAGIGLGELLRNLNRQAVLALALFGGFLCWPLAKNIHYYFYSPDELSRAQFGPVFIESQEIARYINRHTSPNDYFFQWGMAMELYFLSGRRTPSRYTSNLLLTWSEAPEKSIQEMLTSLRNNKPVYVYVDRAWCDFTGYDELKLLLQKEYFPEKQFNGGVLYRLGAAPTGARPTPQTAISHG